MTFIQLWEIFANLSPFIIIGYISLRIAYPYKCKCGRRSIFPRVIFRHRELRHEYLEK
jgi:hypothetical protein